MVAPRAPPWPPKIMQIKWVLSFKLQATIFRTIMHPCMLNGSQLGRPKKHTFSLLNVHLSLLGPPNVTNLRLQMATWVNMSFHSPLSRALLGLLATHLGYQPVSDANFRPRIHSFGTYLSFAHHVLPKTWPTFGCKRFFRPKLSSSSPSFPLSRDLLIDLPLIYSSTCVHLSMKLTIYLSFLSSNAYNMLWVAGGICIIQNTM